MFDGVFVEVNKGGAENGVINRVQVFIRGIYEGDP